MKKTILFIGALFFLLVAIPSYAQKISNKQKKETTKIGKTQMDQKFKKPSEMGNSTLPTISSPKNMSQVTSPLIIKGTASKDGQIEVSVEAIFTGGSQDLGAFKVTANSSGEWSTIPINLWVPDDAKNVKFQISATETIGNKKSESETVIVLPPEKVKTVARAKISKDMIVLLNRDAMTKISVKPKLNLDHIINSSLPTISLPKNNSQVKSPLTISGTASKNEPIEVNVTAAFTGGSQDLGTLIAQANNSGEWNTIINLWVPEGAKNVKFQISALQTVNNEESKSKLVTVLPPQKVKTIAQANIKEDMIMKLNPKVAAKKVTQKVTPKSNINAVLAKAAALPTITSPSHQTVIMTPLVIEGTAHRGSTVEVTIASNHAKPNSNIRTISVKTDESGEWKTMPIELWLFEDATDARFTITVDEIDTRTHKRLTSKPITVIPSIDQNFPRRPIKPWGTWFPTANIQTKYVDSPMILRGAAGKERIIQIVISSEYTDSKGKKVNLPDIKSATTSDAKGRWTSNPIVLHAPLTEKLLTNIVKISQIDHDLVSESSEFKITSDPNRVVKPTIIYPVEGSKVKRYTVIKGTGVPNRYINIMVQRIIILNMTTHHGMLQTTVLRLIQMVTGRLKHLTLVQSLGRSQRTMNL